MPRLLYEPECAVDSFLERGSGTELMIKSAIEYAYNDVKILHIFEFEDDSHIDCIEKDMLKKPPIKPLNLAFFYIAYYGKTWYEARFNAKIIDAMRYNKYRKCIDFLIDPAQKLPFINFLQIIGYSSESIDRLTDLEKYYIRAATYRDFFENIPKIKRCDILFGWLNTFMNHYIGHTFSYKGWYIDVTKMNDIISIQTGGASLSPKLKYHIFSYKSMSNF